MHCSDLQLFLYANFAEDGVLQCIETLLGIVSAQVLPLVLLTPIISPAVRALKMHGGGPPVVAGRPLDHAYTTENVELVRAGCCNLAKHVANMSAYGVPVVVALNRFASDTDAELEAIKVAALEAGAC